MLFVVKNYIKLNKTEGLSHKEVLLVKRLMELV